MKQLIDIHSLNLSKKKGVVKNPVPEARFTLEGMEGDAHSGPWHRQVSMPGSGEHQEI